MYRLCRCYDYYNRFVIKCQEVLQREPLVFCFVGGRYAMKGLKSFKFLRRAALLLCRLHIRFNQKFFFHIRRKARGRRANAIPVFYRFPFQARGS